MNKRTAPMNNRSTPVHTLNAFWMIPTPWIVGLLLIVCCTSNAHAQRRRRVAVMAFDVAGGARASTQQAGIRDDIGRDLADLLIQRLVTDGKFAVIERTALDKVLKEQNITNSDRFDSSQAARIGKIAGVDAIIIGSISEFGLEQTTTTRGALLRGIHLNGANGATFDEKNSKAVVATTARLVDTNTGEILASATGVGDATKTQRTVVSQGSGNRLGYDTKSSNFANTLIGEATLKAIAATAIELESAKTLSVDLPPPPRVPYSGIVADVNGSEIILTVGSKAGVQLGDTVEISKAGGRIVRDPATGAPIRTIREHLGTAKVTEVDSSSATAVYTGAPVKVKDTASSTEK